MDVIAAAGRCLRLMALAGVLALAACGGGNGADDENPPPPTTNPPPVTPPPGTPQHPPVARAGANQNARVGETLTLSAAASTDQDGGTLAYAWSQLTGTAVTLSSSTAVSTTFAVPVVETAELLTFQLTVTDSQGNAGTDSVAVAVAAVNGEVASLGLTLAEADPMVAAAGKAFIVRRGLDAEGPVQLWASGGTTGSTLMLREGRIVGEPSAAPNGIFFVERGTAPDARDLWFSNGTPTATRLVKSFAGGIDVVGVYDGRIWFMARESRLDRQLWVSNGTAQGTVRLGKLGSEGSGMAVSKAAFFRGKLYFFADLDNGDWTPVRGYLCVTDGTPDSVRVVYTSPDRDANTIVARMHLAAYNDRLYFDFPGDEFYMSDEKFLVFDGSRVHPFIDTVPEDEYENGAFARIEAAGGLLLFTAYEPAGVAARERSLWASNGTQQGTRALARVEVGPDRFVAFRGRVYFRARPYGSLEYRLWSTDGTPAGTREVSTAVVPDSWASDPRLVVLGDRILFQGNDGARGLEPWITDGTAAGTMLLKDIDAHGGSYPSVPGAGGFVVRGDRAYFVASQGADDFQLFETDGTAAGTRTLAPANAAATVSPMGRAAGTRARVPYPLPVLAGETLLFKGTFSDEHLRLYRQ